MATTPAAGEAGFARLHHFHCLPFRLIVTMAMPTLIAVAIITRHRPALKATLFPLISEITGPAAAPIAARPAKIVAICWSMLGGCILSGQPGFLLSSTVHI